ncbi:MAG: hypothetical protein FWG22_03265 [Prolixibacteraceae bacterium]|nr:hypothetical protein [Prolixibacteraceae bacterium]
MDFKKFFENNRFAAKVGIVLLEMGVGTTKAKLEITDNHLKAVNIVQGGAIDFAFAVASNSHENMAIVINNSIAYIKIVSKGTCLSPP